MCEIGAESDVEHLLLTLGNLRGIGGSWWMM